MTFFVAVVRGPGLSGKLRIPLRLWIIEPSSVGTGAAVEVCIGEVTTEEHHEATSTP
jgi:hypothetical protein